ESADQSTWQPHCRDVEAKDIDESSLFVDAESGLSCPVEPKESVSGSLVVEDPHRELRVVGFVRKDGVRKAAEVDQPDDERCQNEEAQKKPLDSPGKRAKSGPPQKTRRPAGQSLRLGDERGERSLSVDLQHRSL